MMADLPVPPYVDMQTALDGVIAAHTAVAEGIATHAQKETAARDERRRSLEAQRRLSAPLAVTRHGN